MSHCMKKKTQKLDKVLLSRKNPVAKFAYQYNRSRIFSDKTKYSRKAKHKSRESFPIQLCFSA